MAQLIDPGGARTSPHFRLFEEAVVRAYIAVGGVRLFRLVVVAL